MTRSLSRTRLLRIYHRLLEHYGPQQWWPAESDLEMMIGAILVQNTSWRNAARAIDVLRDADLLDARRLLDLPIEQLEEHLQSCGYFRIKTRRLRNLLHLIVDKFDGQLDRMWQLDAEPLRRLLLGVNGVGPETADSIVLYAARQPRFVVDKYTWRVLVRHGWISSSAKYDDMQTLFERRLPADVKLFGEFHALLVRVGNDRCKSQPHCDGCPLRSMLPRSGPVELT